LYSLGGIIATTMTPNRTVLLIVVIVGALLGIWHLWFAASAVFVFRNGEPWWSWVAVLFGPGLTLLAVLIAIFSVRLGGILLLVGACLSMTAFAVGDGPQYSSVEPFLLYVVLPMGALGVALLAFSRSVRNLVPTSHSSNAA
jgi:hypothetical protein